MVEIRFEETKDFTRILDKIKDNSLKIKIKKQIKKIIENPEIGKPMRHNRKGTREVYVSPFRLSYFYSQEENKVIFLDFYHKDEQ
ncbi:MAG: type II toxin-antitoxin system RelE/ParE family toxin [Nanoarchaeota archaeon]|nr:type II toxin-antitoxin system RelE/ParE family toxin [Nanoarchaeota archaeon]